MYNIVIGSRHWAEDETCALFLQGSAESTPETLLLGRQQPQEVLFLWGRDKEFSGLEEVPHPQVISPYCQESGCGGTPQITSLLYERACKAEGMRSPENQLEVTPAGGVESVVRRSSREVNETGWMCFKGWRHQGKKEKVVGCPERVLLLCADSETALGARAGSERERLAGRERAGRWVWRLGCREGLGMNWCWESGVLPPKDLTGLFPTRCPAGSPCGKCRGIREWRLVVATSNCINGRSPELGELGFSPTRGCPQYFVT